MKLISLDRVIELSFKTSLAYFVFFFSFSIVPYAQALWQHSSQAVKVFEVEKYVVIAETKVTVEVADSESELAKGLSGKKTLAPGTGMLFIFDTNDTHGIWMKNMLFPIDVIWIAENMQVVHLEQNIAPNTYPTSFKPNRPARFVLEVPAGFISEEGIKNGDLLTVF